MASQKRIDSIWDKAHSIRGKNPNMFRKDDFGNMIRKQSYGTQGQYGWEIDHKNPRSKGGTNSPKNLRPLHWKENRSKGSKYPY